MYNKNHNRLLLGGGIAVCLLIAVTSLCLGNVHFTPVQLISLFRGQGDKVSRSILLYARLPRTLASLAAGAGLAVSAITSSSRIAVKIRSSRNRFPRRAEKRTSMAVFFSWSPG